MSDTQEADPEIVAYNDDVHGELGLNGPPKEEAPPDLNEVYQSVADAKPDHASKVLSISAKTGEHPETVSDNLDEFEQMMSAPSAEQFKNIQKQHPVVGKFLSDPANMAQSYDDTHNLVQHSHANQELERANGIADAIAVGLENSILGTTLRNKQPDMAFGPDSSFAEKFTGSAAQFAADFPFMAAGGAAGGALGFVVGGPVGAVAGAGMGGFALPDAYREALKAHMASGDEASAVDLIKQFYSLNVMKSGLKGAGLGLLTAGAGAAAKPFGALAVGAAEVATMTAVPALAEGKAPSLEDVASNALLMGLMHGAGVLGGEALDRTFPQRVADTVRVETTRDAAELQDESSRASKLRKRNPEAFEKLMNQGKPVMVPVESYEMILNQAGVDPGMVSNDLGVAESHEYARQRGPDTPVIIPQGKWLSEAMDPYRSKFIDDIKFDKEHLTANELKLVVEQEKVNKEAAREFVKKNGEDAAKIIAANEPMRQTHEDLMADARNRLETRVPTDIQSSGQGDKWLDKNAKIVADHYVAESSRRGVDPKKLYDAEFPKISGSGRAEPTALQQPGDLLERRAKTVTWEAVPSLSLGLDINNASPAAKKAFTADSQRVIQGTDGRDLLAEKLGLKASTERGSGGYTSKDKSGAMVPGINPNRITSIFSGDPKKVDAYARALQYIFKQDAVPWMQAQKKGEHNAVMFTFSGDITPEVEADFYDKMRAVLTNDHGHTKLNSREIVVGNFSDMPHADFLAALGALRNEHGTRLGIEGARSFASGGNYLAHDWSADPEGKTLLSGIGRPSKSGSPDLQSWLADRQAAAQSLQASYSGEALAQREADLAANPTPDSLAQEAPNSALADASYSKLLQTLDEKIQGKSATKEQIEALAKNFKEDERKWTGFDKFMDGKSGKIDKAELINFMKANRLQVEDRVTGERVEPETPESGKELATTGEPTEAEFRTWAENEGMGPRAINDSWRSRNEGDDTRLSSYDDFLEHRRVEAGGLPHIDTLDDDELFEKVKEQYDDEINELANEKESENIDQYMSDNSDEWTVKVEAQDREAEDIDDINEGDPGEWIVDFDNGRSGTYSAASEEEARTMAEKDIDRGAIESNTDGYKLTLNGRDYTHTERRNGQIIEHSWFDSEREAQDAAERATERESDSYRENMWGNTDGSEYREATDEIVQEVRDGERELDGYENGGGSKKKGAPAKKEFKWEKARWPSGGSYTTPGAIPGSEREIIFHVPQLEDFETDDNHFGKVSKRRIGWARTSLHNSDKNAVVRLADEFQNDRTQKGAAEGYKGDDNDRWAEWKKGNDALHNIFMDKSAIFNSVVEGIKKRYYSAIENGAKSLTTEQAYMTSDPEYEAADEAVQSARANLSASNNNQPGKGNVPDTPFKNNWHEFQFKRLLRWHIEQDYKDWQADANAGANSGKLPFLDWWKKHGIKQLAWTTGMQQAERNNRADDVDKLVYDPVKQELSAYKNGRNLIDKAKMPPDTIAERLGNSPQAQEIVKRLLATKPNAEAPSSDDMTVIANPDTSKPHTLLVTAPGGFSFVANANSNENAKAEAMTAWSEHPGSHVIHDEGGIKVAANAKFYTDLYDGKIRRFAEKFGKQWGATVGEAMLSTGEQEGAYRYEGDEPGMFALNKVGREIAGGGDSFEDRQLKNSIAQVLEGMKGGRKFSEMMAEGIKNHNANLDYERLATMFGGKMVKDKVNRYEKFHALEISPEMAQAAITQGFPLFQGEGSNPQGEYIPSLNEIRLGKNSNASTFMHEFSHGALKHMFDFVKSGQATPEYLDHWKAASDFLDIKSDQTALTREQQEKFARGWERYLRGEEEPTKAPTKELQGTFNLFRKWLTKVYKQIAGSPIEGKLTPEMRGFFDRMVATDEQIAQAAQAAGYKDAEIASLEGIDPATQERHRTLQERARAQAEDELLKEQMAELRDAHKATLDKERERLTAQAGPQVAELPVFQSGADLQDEFGKNRLPADLAKSFLEGKSNDHEAMQFERIAALNGFEDGVDMARQLVTAWEKGGSDAEVKARVDAGMAPFADLKDTAKIKEAALKAIHDHKMTELLALEQEILSGMQHDQEVRGEVAKRRRVSASMAAANAKQQAKDYLAGQSLREAASFKSYITAERKAAVRVSQAVAAKDFAAAAKAKGEQMLNHALASEAMRNRDEINRKGKYLDKFIKRGQDMKKMPFGFITKIDDMLVQHGLMDPRDPALQDSLAKNAETMAEKGEAPAEIANATGLVRDSSGKWARETLPQFISRVNEDYYPISLPDSVMQGGEGLQQRNPNMTLAELRDLTEAVKIVNQVGVGFERFLSDFIKGDLKTNAAKLKAQIAKNIGTPHGDIPALGELDMNKLEKAVAAIKAQPDGMITSKVNLLTLCEYLDRLDPNGEAKNNIYRPLQHSWNKEREMRSRMASELEAIRNKHFTRDEIGKMSDESFATWQIQTPSGMKNVRLTRENAIILLLNRGSESNLDRITRGFGINAEKVQEITDGLSKKDHDFAQAVWDYVDKLWPDASALEMKVNGVEPKKVKAQTVKSVHGDYRGGYYPLSYDFEKSIEAATTAEQRNALFKQYSTASAQTEQGALKERVKTLARPVRLTFDGLFGHLDDVIHDITHREAIIDVARFLNQPDAKNSIINAIGIDGYKKIGDDLKRVGSSQAEFLTPIDKKMRWFRFGTTMATLGYRFSIFPRRLTEDVMNASREVGFRGMIGSVGDYVMNPKVTQGFVRERSVLMRDRQVNRERDLMEMSNQWKGRDSKLKQFAFLQDTVADQALSYPVWKSVYDSNLAKHGESRAIELADESIVKTFGSGRELDKVGAQRGSELNRLISMYYSWHSMMFNRAWLQGKIAGLEYNEGNYGKAMAIIASTTATTWLIPAAIDIFWHEVLHNSPQGQETDEEKHKRRLSKFLEAPFAYFPMARNVAAFGIPKLLGEHGRAYKMSPAEDAIENLTTTAAEGAHTMFDLDKEFDQKFMEQAARSASILMGTPQQLNMWVFNLKDFLDGEGDLTWKDLISRRAKK